MHRLLPPAGGLPLQHHLLLGDHLPCESPSSLEPHPMNMIIARIEPKFALLLLDAPSTLEEPSTLSEAKQLPRLCQLLSTKPPPRSMHLEQTTEVTPNSRCQEQVTTKASSRPCQEPLQLHPSLRKGPCTWSNPQQLPPLCQPSTPSKHDDSLDPNLDTNHPLAEVKGSQPQASPNLKPSLDLRTPLSLRGGIYKGDLGKEATFPKTPLIPGGSIIEVNLGSQTAVTKTLLGAVPSPQAALHPGAAHQVHPDPRGQ